MVMVMVMVMLVLMVMLMIMIMIMITMTSMTRPPPPAFSLMHVIPFSWSASSANTARAVCHAYDERASEREIGQQKQRACQA